MLSLDFDSLSRQSNKQTLMRAKICHCDHGTPLPSSHCRLPRKLRLTLTLMVSWNHSSLTWMLRGGKRTKIHQKVVNNDINLNRSIAKAAQNKTTSAGLGRATIDWCFFIFQSPISILPWANWQTTTKSAVEGWTKHELAGHWSHCN